MTDEDFERAAVSWLSARGWQVTKAGSTQAPTSTPTPPALSTDFDDFWKLYPRGDSKGDARKAFANALKKASATVLISSLSAQVSKGWFGEEKKWMPHASRWLNDERWEDTSPRRRLEAPKPAGPSWKQHLNG